MHSVRDMMQKIREMFLPSASMGQSGAMIPVNGYETGSKPNWGTKTAW
jgi:hypothetical protein